MNQFLKFITTVKAILSLVLLIALVITVNFYDLNH